MDLQRHVELIINLRFGQFLQALTQGVSIRKKTAFLRTGLCLDLGFHAYVTESHLLKVKIFLLFVVPEYL